MPRACKVGPDGTFVIGKRSHQIPETFSDRQVHSFRTLLEPIPDNPSGPSMSDSLRRKQRDYLMRRSLAAVIPGLPLKVLQKASMTQVRSIHEWIARHRPELMSDAEVTLE
ncbi:MAG: hypothetical protein AMS21_04330 [Gemmatimonas sp. SG8_38_2]|nr:MAG: hypothetical protein AMS21_04330 [Gemmatimonas sp. SG8_38_2]